YAKPGPARPGRKSWAPRRRLADGRRASGRRLVAPPLTRRLGPRAQRQLVVHDERVVHPVWLRGVGTRIDGHEIRAHPHDGYRIAPVLIPHDARLHVVARLLTEHDRLEGDHGPAEE